MADTAAASRRQAYMEAAVASAPGVVAGVDIARSDFHSFLYQSHGPEVDEYVKQLEYRTQLKREQLSYIAGGLLGAYLIFGGLAHFICNMIGFAYPCYVSVKAIRTEGKDDDTKWLIYWTVFAAFSLIDCFADPIMSLFPIYFVVKALFLVYLYLPQTNGAEYLYKAYVDPAVTAIDAYLDGRRGGGSGTPAPAEQKSGGDKPADAA